MARLRSWMHSISVKITVYYLLAFTAVLFFVVLVMGSLFQDRMAEDVSTVVEQKMSMAGVMLERSMDEVRSLYYSLVRNTNLQQTMQASPGEMSLADVMRMKDELSRVLARYASVRSIILISSDGVIYDPIYEAEPYKQLLLSDPEYARFRTSPYTSRFSAPTTFPIVRYQPVDSQQHTITFFGRFYDLTTYLEMGTVAINVKMPSLTEDVRALFEETFDSAMIVDEHGSVILSTGQPLNITPAQMRDAEGSLTIDGAGYTHFSHRLSGYPNWTLAGVVSHRTISAQVHNLYMALLLVCALVMLLLIYIGASISHRITSPLRALSASMARLGQGDWSEVSDESSTREIEELMAGDNTMVHSLHQLTDRITQEQVEKRRIKVAMLQSKLDLLQSQINPHFIHNTLNTMRYLAQKEGVTELADMIVSFNSLLRLSMSQSSVTHTLAEEFENLNHYMFIQRKRYDADLDFSLDAEEAAQAVQVPKLLLQPLVENALFHGILPLGKGSIRVLARVADGRLWLSVIDDGAGMSPEVLAGLLDGTLPNARGYNHIGLQNVNDRLILFYGPSSHLVVDSSPGRGCTISFSLPTAGHMLR